ncbi:hypothetical protein EMCRGX_G000500 [Ephydatia muelleri]
MVRGRGRNVAVSVFSRARDLKTAGESLSVFFLVLSIFSSVALPEVDLKVRIDNSAFDVCLRWPWRSIETRSKLGVEALILDPRLMADNNFERDTALLSYKQYAEAAPASTKGRGQAHEGRQKGAWLTIL